MARARTAHGSEDIWHLSIDDLLVTPEEPARLAGGGPFVINLSTSTASIGPPPEGLRSFEGLQLYQLRRGPEDQPQFLLRLGIIETEVEADAILACVLEHYPGARKDSVEDDDRAAVASKARPAEPPKAARPSAENPPLEVRRPPPNPAPPRPPIETVPTRELVEGVDDDPDAITHELEIPTFMFEAVELEAPTAAAPKVEVPRKETSPVESRPLRPVTPEPSAIEVPAEDEPTIEAPALDVATLEASTAEVTTAEASTVDAREIRARI